MSQAASTRPFEPGTTGWSVADLDDPQIERLWVEGAYEIVDGVLAKMPPADYDGSLPLARLVSQLWRWQDETSTPGDFGTGVDVVIDLRRLAVADCVWLTPEDQARQRRANAESGDPRVKFGRLLIPPALVIESVSMGHESHDRETKRRWYAEFGIPNYWILDAYQRTLDCLVLDGNAYRVDAAGRDKETVRPTVFVGLEITLASLWG